MKWQIKAKIMSVVSNLPYSEAIYKWLQKKLGRLHASPMDRLPMQLEITKCLLENGCEVEGKRFFEVGTGHVPVLPIGFFICGAKSVATVDLHRRIDYEVFRKTLSWFVLHRVEVEGLYQSVVEKRMLAARLDIIEKYADAPESFMKESGIIYMAPADAGSTGMLSGSIDYHFSCTVLEHVPLSELRRIFIEAKRILSSTGKLIHFIDPSDHFQHQDSKITKVNFLRFSDKDWENLAGNQFAYCNRLRMSDYIELFLSLDYLVESSSSSVDQESLESLSNGFQLAERFRKYHAEDVCAMDVNILCGKRDE